MPAPKTASELTQSRESRTISYYQNALEVTDPNNKILTRPKGGKSASFVSALLEAKTEENLGITVFRQTYSNVTPDLSQYPKSKVFGDYVEILTNTTYTIPTGSDGVEVHLWGGGGGGTRGGSGAYVTGTINLGGGTPLNVILNAGKGNTVGLGSMGGGYTGIYRGTNVQSNYLAIAGAGGGATNAGATAHVGGGATWSGTAFQGGPPGTNTRSTSSNAADAYGGSWSFGGGGGSQTQGGDRGGTGSTAGSALQGGQGSTNPNNAQGYQLLPGGGGGGYFGGGGSGDTYTFTTGGGGGSSYTGGLVNASGEDGAPGSSVPGGTTTKYYVSGYGGATQNGRAVLVPFQFQQII